MSASYPPRILKPSIAVQTNNSTQLNSSTSNWASLSDSNEFTTSPSTHSPVFHPLSDSISSSNNNHDDKNNKNNKNNNNLNLNLNPTSASTSTTSLASSTSPSSQAIFTQLQKIKTLQKEIAESHSILEGIGETSKQQSWYKDENNSGATTGDQGGRKSEKEGMKLSYEEMSKEFTERQENVQNIMIKLSSLSSALKTFHALPAPQLFPEDQVNPLDRSLGRSNSKVSGTIPLSSSTASDLGERPSYGRKLSYD